MNAHKVREVLTDGSEVWNVRLEDEGLDSVGTLIFGCIDEQNADDLFAALQRCVWAETV